MSEAEKIREAVARLDEPILSYLVATRWSQIEKNDINPHWLTGLGLAVPSVVTEAALAYADLLANAEQVWWCGGLGKLEWGNYRKVDDGGDCWLCGFRQADNHCGPRLLTTDKQNQTVSTTETNNQGVPTV